jgi:hypothetical protein
MGETLLMVVSEMNMAENAEAYAAGQVPGYERRRGKGFSRPSKLLLKKASK